MQRHFIIVLTNPDGQVGLLPIEGDMSVETAAATAEAILGGSDEARSVWIAEVPPGAVQFYRVNNDKRRVEWEEFHHRQH
ncbi:hypothetical protein [Belnapia moabensis]|uniref:hypothetical protein n=1 Tax=Belnapia moabensis TaxID=365533 RepID=UPI0005B93432|nr:hypothetical protein [Belnapia moabensis]